MQQMAHKVALNPALQKKGDNQDIHYSRVLLLRSMGDNNTQFCLSRVAPRAGSREHVAPACTNIKRTLYTSEQVLQNHSDSWITLAG
jgi:hypothetical protein